jgi:hypothetical protein
MGTRVWGLGPVWPYAYTPALPWANWQATINEAKVDVRIHGFRHTYRIHRLPDYNSA